VLQIGLRIMETVLLGLARASDPRASQTLKPLVRHTCSALATPLAVASGQQEWKLVRGPDPNSPRELASVIQPEIVTLLVCGGSGTVELAGRQGG
jgi:hypothetical protein